MDAEVAAMNKALNWLSGADRVVNPRNTTTKATCGNPLSYANLRLA